MIYKFISEDVVENEASLIEFIPVEDGVYIFAESIDTMTENRDIVFIKLTEKSVDDLIEALLKMQADFKTEE